MRRLFLIRAYGDFVIAIRAILNSKHITTTKIIASEHFKPLHTALAKVMDLAALQIEFQDFEINNAQLNLFTDRHLINIGTITQIKKIRKYLVENSNEAYTDYLEQARRIKLFEFLTKHSFEPIVKKSRVYNEYTAFSNAVFEDIEFKIKNTGRILILPDARIQKRNLPQEIVQEIIHHSNEKNYQVQVAYFKRVSQVDKKGKVSSVQFKTDLIFSQKVYNNFDELIQLIQAADFVIGADSLPIHLLSLIHISEPTRPY